MARRPASTPARTPARAAGRSSEDTEDGDSAVPRPRETAVLYGHDAAERTFLSAWRSGRVPHAWLLGGEPGIGKATLAFRIARFVLAHPDPAQAGDAASLAVDPAHPTARRVAAGAHSDLLVLERAADDKTGRLRTVISVEQVRRLSSFFGATAGEGGWRVAIVDRADELKYPEASNALLKMLEEPPPRSLFLLVSQAPGRLLPTIRSRCRLLAMRPLRDDDVARAAAAALGRPGGDDLAAAAAASRGSVARAVALVDGQAGAVRQQVADLLRALPDTDPRGLHALGEALDRDRDRGGLLEVFADAVRDWLSARLTREGGDLAKLARFADLWERLNRAVGDAQVLHLEKKPLVFLIFRLAADAVRG